jgi:hypothetical protein
MRLAARTAVLAGIMVAGANMLHAQVPAAPAAIIARITAEDLAALLTQAGLLAEAEGSPGARYVEAHFFNSSTGFVQLKDCVSDGCSRLVFLVWPKLAADPDAVNRWNRRAPGLVRASLDKGKLRFDMSVDLAGGVSREHVEQSAFAFVTLVNRAFPGVE